MRVLVVTTPGWGHIAPMLPVAEAVRSRGHEVRWVTAADSAPTLADKGFTVRPHGMPIAERLPRAMAIMAERAAGIPPGEVRALAFTINFALLATPSTLEGVSAEVTTFRPDVILREPAELSSALVGHRAGLPVATVGFGGFVPAPALRMADEALAVHVDAIGLARGSEDLHFGALYLHPMPASMDDTAPPAAVRRIRPPRAPLTSDVPAVLAGFGADRPGVYGTFGTEFGAMAPWAELLDALGALDVDALVTTGAAGLPPGVAVPANVRVAPFVDQALVLDRAAAVVSHAGSGSLLGAAAAGCRRCASHWAPTSSRTPPRPPAGASPCGWTRRTGDPTPSPPQCGRQARIRPFAPPLTPSPPRSRPPPMQPRPPAGSKTSPAAERRPDRRPLRPRLSRPEYS